MQVENKECDQQQGTGTEKPNITIITVTNFVISPLGSTSQMKMVRAKKEFSRKTQ